MFRKGLRGLLMLILFAGVLAAVKTARAAGVVGDGTPASCTEDAFIVALSFGGPVTFNCGGPKTILLLHPLTIPTDTTISGGDTITLTGGLATSLFTVNPNANLTMENIVLDSFFRSGSDGGAIANHGTLILDHVKIQFSQTDINHSGGAISTDGTATITDSIFQNNTGGSGGAIFANTGNAKVTIVGSLFQNNQTVSPTAGLGGAILVGEDAQLFLRDSEFVTNQALFGGGLYASSRAKIMIEGSPSSSAFTSQMKVINNTSTFDGGGIYNRGRLTLDNTLLTGNITQDGPGFQVGGAIYSNSTLTVTNSVLSQNQSIEGGGIFIAGDHITGVQAVIDHSAFNQNTAIDSGGGLYAVGTVVSVTNSTFDTNLSFAGGGLTSDKTRMYVSNSSFTGNNAAGGGGGINVSPAPITSTYAVTLTSVTFSGNLTDHNLGGGIYNSGKTQLVNVTIKDNKNGVYNDAGRMSLRNTVLDNPGTLNCDGTGALPVNNGGNFVTDQSCGTGFGASVIPDARLSPLQNDPNATSYYLPQEGSPLINAGIAGESGADGCPALDQRGVARYAQCDSGAVEFIPPIQKVYVPWATYQ